MQSQSLAPLFALTTWQEHTIRLWWHVLRPVCHAGHWTAERQSLSTWRAACILSLCMLTGCAAAYSPPPLTVQHPAHPEATTAPALPPSTTLAYGPADRPA